MNPHAFFLDFIKTWEGELSVDPDDSGNWFSGQLIGSKYGVTGAALQAYRGGLITPKDIANLTIGEAADIGEKNYYRTPGFDRLPWDGVLPSVVDFGWGVGPGQAARVLQRLIGVADDGVIGPWTVRAYREWIASHGLEETARLWQKARDDFYRLVVAKRPINAKYLRGWMRRSAYFVPGGPWWKRFTT